MVVKRDTFLDVRGLNLSLEWRLGLNLIQEMQVAVKERLIEILCEALSPLVLVKAIQEII